MLLETLAYFALWCLSRNNKLILILAPFICLVPKMMNEFEYFFIPSSVCLSTQTKTHTHARMTSEVVTGLRGDRWLQAGYKVPAPRWVVRLPASHVPTVGYMTLASLSNNQRHFLTVLCMCSWSCLCHFWVRLEGVDTKGLLHNTHTLPCHPIILLFLINCVYELDKWGCCQR